MGNKYSGLQIGIHWLVFCWLLWRTAPWSFADFSRAAIALFNMVRLLRYHYFNADGGASAGQAEIPGSADCAKTEADDDRNGASGASGYLSVVYCPADYWAGDDVQPG